MLHRWLKLPVRDDFVVIDHLFPQKSPFSFRNSEINNYMMKIKNFRSYTMYPMKPGTEAWFDHAYGMTPEQYTENKAGYLEHYPKNNRKIRYLDESNKYSFKLAYSFFLGETYTLLPFYEKNNIPFVFVLYPGGGFGLDFDASDGMLQKIFQSPQFRGVIVTQQITRDYLIRKNLCPEDQIHFIYGGFVQFRKADVKPKKYYKRDKHTFDICFVAAKYSDKGVDKGYDLFIKTAKNLCKKTDDVMFHVVGGFDETDIDVSDIKDRITFYGYRRPDFLLDFYAGMDIFLGPNRPFKLFTGNFDGFPLGIDAAYCGAALFVGDELGMNHYYKEGSEIVITPLSAAKITAKILSAYNNLDSFYELSDNGKIVTQRLFDLDYQVNERIKVFEKFTRLKLNSTADGRG